MPLLGLVYCGYCEKRLIRGTGTRKRARKDGTEIYTRRQRYICSRRLSHKERCGGPSEYGPNTLEETVIGMVSKVLWNMQDATWIGDCTAWAAGEEARIVQEMGKSEQKMELIESELSDLNREVVKALRNESEIGIAVLQGAIEHTNKRLKAEKQRGEDLEKALSVAQWRHRRFLDTASRSDALLEALHHEDVLVVTETLRGLINKIELFGPKDIRITYHFSLPDEN